MIDQQRNNTALEVLKYWYAENRTIEHVSFNFSYLNLEFAWFYSQVHPVDVLVVDALDDSGTRGVVVHRYHHSDRGAVQGTLYVGWRGGAF